MTWKPKQVFRIVATRYQPGTYPVSRTDYATTLETARERSCAYYREGADSVWFYQEDKLQKKRTQIAT